MPANHEGMHAFHIPAEDPADDADPQINRCIKTDETTGQRCSYTRPASDIPADRAYRRRLRLARETPRPIPTQSVRPQESTTEGETA